MCAVVFSGRRFPFVISSSTLALSMAAGCSRTHTQTAGVAQPTTEEMTSNVNVQPFITQTQTLPVNEGMPPLFYMVETAGAVRVVDLNTGEPVGQADASERSIVAVDAKRGVSIGDVLYTRGPLPVNHHYAIYLKAGGANLSEIRSGVVRGRPSVFDRSNKSTTQSSGATTGPSSP